MGNLKIAHIIVGFKIKVLGSPLKGRLQCERNRPWWTKSTLLLKVQNKVEDAKTNIRPKATLIKASQLPTLCLLVIPLVGIAEHCCRGWFRLRFVNGMLLIWGLVYACLLGSTTVIYTRVNYYTLRYYILQV